MRRVDFGYFVRPVEETGTGHTRVEAVLGYLVEHPDGLVLVDTGMGSHPEGDTPRPSVPRRARRRRDRHRHPRYRPRSMTCVGWPSCSRRWFWSCRSGRSAERCRAGTSWLRRPSGPASAAPPYTSTVPGFGSAPQATAGRRQRSPAAIAALFDTVYVSFYKGLGALAGCCLAGPADVVPEVREWRTLHGGTLFALWPYAASALAALHTRLPRMPDYHRHAVAIAEVLRDLSRAGSSAPPPPQTPMMHLLLDVDPDLACEQTLRMAADDGIWTW